MSDLTVNRFRSARGRVLHRQIGVLARHLGRDIRVLDVGGRPDYWRNVGVGNIEGIEVLNHNVTELERAVSEDLPAGLFTHRIGDARDLSDYGDGSIDLVHSNSVIEHVGRWADMGAMAGELLRVGRAGWVQTPAWEFPVEPHFQTLFAHWFGQPLRVRMMSLSISSKVRRQSLDHRRRRVDSVNLLSRREMKALFPGCDIFVERVILAKSYAARWMPEGAQGW